LAQDRVAEFEEPTAGYLVGDLWAGLELAGVDVLHGLDLRIENVADTEYRRHLSRVKEIMPEPGRNLRLLYTVHF
jgi:iron complex outermembrane receptor protein